MTRPPLAEMRLPHLCITCAADWWEENHHLGPSTTPLQEMGTCEACEKTHALSICRTTNRGLSTTPLHEMADVARRMSTPDRDALVTLSREEVREREEVARSTILVGYARRASPPGAFPPGSRRARQSNGANQTIRLSLNSHALEDCETYQTSDGQNYIVLEIGIENLNMILDGTRTACAVAQQLGEY